MTSEVVISCDSFGKIKNKKNQEEEVLRYTMTTSELKVQIISYGATITSIKTPDKMGKWDDVVLGFDNIEGYLDADNPYFGAIIGRVANRIANAKIQCDEKIYELTANAPGGNHLHGGNVGFDKVNWNSLMKDNKLIFTYLSVDGEEGYPGDLLVTVAYQIDNINKLMITYNAVSSKKTVVNLTNHSYFNLAGHGSGCEGLYSHNIQINSDKITLLNENLVATGELKDVANTAYNFRVSSNLGKAINGFPLRGIDINYCLNGVLYPGIDIQKNSNIKTVVFAARVIHPETGRYLEVNTDQPGVQLYTGNFIPDGIGKEGTRFSKHSAFCLETQNYPNSVNVESFPSPILEPGQQYLHITTFTFGIVND